MNRNLKLAVLALIQLILGGTVEASVQNQTNSSLLSLIAKSKPAIVGIVFVTDKQIDPTQNPPPALPMKGDDGKDRYLYILGSGFFVSKDGLIITCHHVIQPFDKQTISILTSDGKVAPASRVTDNEKLDYAILSTKVSRGTFLELGGFQSIQEGQDVIFIGYPFGEMGLTRFC